MNVEEELDFVEEFYTDEAVESEQVQPESKTKVKSKLHQADSFVQEIQQGLQQNLRAELDGTRLDSVKFYWTGLLLSWMSIMSITPNELI